jgi:Zn-dependent protease
MMDNFSWSTHAGRWNGIPVRIHIFLFLFVAAMFGADWNPGTSNSNFFVGTAMVTTLVLLISIVIHELAHVFAISNLGGHVNNLVFMPWGGNSDFVYPKGGQARAVVHLAGPFANGMIFLFGMALLVQSEHSTLGHLINPLQPHWFNATDWRVSLIEIISWVNFQLMLVNLLPCFPFDGAAFIRSMVSSLNVDLPRYRVETGIKLIGTATAFAFMGMAWFMRNYESPPGTSSLFDPAWLPLLACGIALFFSARYSLNVETTTSPDSSWDEMREVEYDSIYSESSYFDFTDETENIAYSQWLVEKQESRRESEIRREEDEDRRADEILKKLHTDGLKSLTDEERSVLDRVSSRIRQRRKEGV